MKLPEIFTKRDGLVVYTLVGVGTTVVGMGSYLLMTRVFGWPENTSNIVSVLCAILTAYFSNKIIVFRVPFSTFPAFAREFLTFLASRGASTVLEIGGFFVLHDLYGLYDLLTKVLVAVVVTITNYTLSKYVIFRKKKEG